MCLHAYVCVSVCMCKCTCGMENALVEYKLLQSRNQLKSFLLWHDCQHLEKRKQTNPLPPFLPYLSTWHWTPLKMQATQYYLHWACAQKTKQSLSLVETMRMTCWAPGKTCCLVACTTALFLSHTPLTHTHTHTHIHTPAELPCQDCAKLHRLECKHGDAHKHMHTHLQVGVTGSTLSRGGAQAIYCGHKALGDCRLHLQEFWRVNDGDTQITKEERTMRLFFRMTHKLQKGRGQCHVFF